MLPFLVGVDWGSSRLRAYGISATGQVLARAESEAGVLTGRSDFKNALLSVLGAVAGSHDDWRELTVLASGMIGSRNGLTEVPYASTPASLSDLRSAMKTVAVSSDLNITIVPGLIHTDGDRVDVLRGEETALLGWSLMNGQVAEQTLVLPGTHSKWARLVQGRVVEFITFPTGELFRTLLDSPALKGLVPHEVTAVDSNDFIHGVETGLLQKGLLNDYFSIRAQLVTGAGPVRDTPSYLSGLLIGYELAEAKNRSGTGITTPVVVMGTGALAQQYVEALSVAGFPATTADDQCLVRGWMALAEGLVPDRTPVG